MPDRKGLEYVHFNGGTVTAAVEYGSERDGHLSSLMSEGSPVDLFGDSFEIESMEPVDGIERLYTRYHLSIIAG